MRIEPEIRFRGMDPSPSVEEVVRDRVARLGRFHDRTTSCKVVIEAPHRHAHQGRIYKVKVEIALPGRKITSGGAGDRDHAHEDVYVAIRDSFDAARRQLEDSVRTRGGHRVKPRPATSRGRVVRISRDEGCAFLSANDGRVFFFRAEGMSSADQWNSLEEGLEVRFVGHEGEQGPHATAVAVVRSSPAGGRGGRPERNRSSK